MADLGGTTIVFVDNYRGTGLGGGQISMRHLVIGARDAGMDVHVVCCPGTSVETAMREVGVTVVTDELGRRNLIRSVHRLSRYARSVGAGLLYSNGFLTNIMTRCASPRRGPHAINSVLVHPSAPRLSGASAIEQLLRDFVTRCTMPRAEAIVAVTRSVRDRLMELGADPCSLCVIHDGVDSDAIVADAAGCDDASRESPVIGMVARLEAVKGGAEFVRMAQIVLQSSPQARFVVIGDGSERASLQRLAEELGVADRLEFAGYVPDAYRRMCEFDVLVIPSRSEGFGLVALEAGALSKPVVATDVGGLPEVIEDGVSGTLVSPRDPQALASAVLGILDDPELASRMGAAAQARVRERFTVERMVQEYLAVCADVLGGA